MLCPSCSINLSSPHKTTEIMAYTNTIEEDYIDIEMIPSSNLLCYTIKSPPQSREFEFQMCSSLSNHTQTTTSPADELFYKGKLLPLHLPLRLQMVRNLIYHDDTVGIASADCNADAPEQRNAISSSNTSSAIESRNVSPSESRRVSNEMNPDEYFFEWSTELTSFINTNNVKKPLSKKVKRSYLGRKLKASRDYLMSLFPKSGCSNESCVKPAANNVEPEAEAIKGKDCLLNYMKVRSRKNQSCQSYENSKGKDYASSNSLIKSIEREMAHEDLFIGQRKSFSGAIQLHSASSSASGSSSSSSSSSFSFGSNGLGELQFLTRSSSASSEIENSIQGAIAHCKMSQQQVSSPKKDREVGEGRFSLVVRQPSVSDSTN